ncbi:TPA: toll/interleukin-1 receptor domain-containing protein [Providencia rettgeri]
MKIFISWSGKESLSIAKTLKDWIPNVIQIAEPYVSAEDIDKGSRWASDISKELDDSSFGIICLTKNNISAPWINFEAGALSKKVDKSKVSPFLFNIKPSEVTGPILQFQHTNSNDRDDVLRLMQSINKQASFLSPERLETAFEHWWPNLRDALSTIETVEVNAQEDTKVKKGKASNDDLKQLSEIVESVLEISRVNHQLLRSPERILPKGYLVSVIDGVRSKDDDGLPEAVMYDLLGSTDRMLNAMDELMSSADVDKDLKDKFANCWNDMSLPLGYLRRHAGMLKRKRSRSSTRFTLTNPSDVLPDSI